MKLPRNLPLIPIGLFILTLLVFANTMTAELQDSWDDNWYVSENPYLPTFPVSTGRMFSEFYFAAYIPVTLFSYGIDYLIWGATPQGYHITNVLLHAINGILVFYLIRRLTDDQQVALVAAVLFLIHPIQVESVAWVSQRKNVLSMLFFLLAFLAHMESGSSTGRMRPIFLLIGVLMFLLCILSKTAAVGAPLLFLAYDVFAHKRMSWLERIARVAPYLLIAVMGAGLMLAGHSGGGGIKEPWGANLWENIAINLRVAWDYVASLVAPFNLNGFYIYTREDVLGNWVLLVLGALVLVGLVVLAIRQPISRPFDLLAVLWIVLFMLPVINIVPIAIQRADRYMYFPSIVVFLGVSILAVRLWDRFTSQQARYILSGIGVGVMAVLIVLTVQRNAVWQNTATLWRDHLTDYPESATGLLNASVYYFRTQDFPEAQNLLQELLRLYPNHYKGNRLLGLTYFVQEFWAPASLYLARAESLSPMVNDIRTELGISLFQRGIELFDEGDYVTALRLYNEALLRVPLSEAPTVLNNIGYTFMTIERYPEAIQVLQAAVQLRPNYLRAWQNLAGSAMAVGEFAIARDAYFSAIALEGEMTPLDNSNLCLAMAETQSDSAQTLGYCQRAVDADPENAMFVGRTAHALLLMNQPQAAAVIAQQAVQMQPPLSLNFRVLGDAYRILGFPAEAELAYREALRIDPDNAAARDGLAALGVTP